MNTDSNLTHFDASGNAIMVDVSTKPVTERVATAKGSIKVSKEVINAITGHTVHKGDVLGVARIAGIMGLKKTSDLIPMCHPLFVTKCSIDFTIDEVALCIHAICTTKVSGQTGVEMEALTGVSIALLTIYDMCKALDRSMEITNIHLVRKSGGKSGDYFNKKFT
ncbi:cyclic pyranopterin monophosphate synthase MoaC [Clostridium lacusfryxellense]|uniref:cyclic pyranopterin monophosphate synthase MoaC n=1 Tax=Clostridium lacusfryxellense TaxID=205328 RepID=UPI001C0E14CE|nr:cyclic pyranopterin monophosphate synthase MoaC [Clostridium lacusfryxellense]MBU3112622.1 cyclic pyranopterin monophosphate synthase MoaC [Clostridium lacusfryxellense]